MPWNLSIETIDVGQGESSFIKAWTNDGLYTRTMLIDGGLAMMGVTVHNHISKSILNQETTMGMPNIFHIDRIIISHFDIDHSGGIIKILEADNFYKLCDIITQHVVQSIAAYTHQSPRVHIIATAAAACAAVVCGAYDDLDGHNYTSLIVDACQRAVDQVDQTPGCDEQQAFEIGMQSAICVVSVNMHNPALVITYAKKKEIAEIAASIAVAAIMQQRPFRDPIFAGIWNSLKTSLHYTDEDNFFTFNIYNQTPVNAIFGNSNSETSATNIINGRLLSSAGSWIRVPGINRAFNPNVIPALGSEIFWNGVAHPVNGPEIFVLAANAYIWNAPLGTVPIGPATNNNNLSFGLVLRFNNFFFYTGGDLPTAGEDLIIDALNAFGLANPAGGIYPVTNQIAAFKCGHHGAKTCTSDYFLQHALPIVAVISCGNEDLYGHPNYETVERVQENVSTFRFYLTGASVNFINTYLNGPDNLGKIAGSDDVAGTITIFVTEDQTNARPRFFTVRYFEWIDDQFLNEYIYF